MFGLIIRILLLSTLFFSLQCRWSDPPPSDTIVFALSSEPKTLDPRYSTDANGQRLCGLIFSSLVRIGQNLEITGDAAQSWVYKDRVFEFQLKPNIRFHNGAPLTNEDLLFTFEQYRNGRSPFAPSFEMINKVEANYDITNGGSLKLYIDQFSAALLSDLPTVKLLPKKEVERLGDDFYSKPIGTGPYKFERKDINNLFLTKNDQYYGEVAKSPKLQFKVIKDDNTRFQKMYKGKIDIVQNDVPYSKIKVFKELENFSVLIESGLSTTYILLNLRNPILSKKEVRQAIHHAIDRDEMIKYTHEGFAEEATSILTKANPYHNHDLEKSKMSFDRVKEILKPYGNKPIVLKTSNTLEAIENGKVIAHQLRSAGLNIDQQSYEWGTYYEDVRTGKFEIAVMKWVGIINGDIYRTSLHSKMVPPGRNRGFYSNPKLDELVTRALHEPDDKKRKELYNLAQKLVYHDLPTIPLWYGKQIAIVHNRVKNYSLPTNGDFSALTKVYKENVTK